MNPEKRCKKLWQPAVMAVCGGRCACASESPCHGPLESHHLLGRRKAVKYSVLNGIVLCAHHHRCCPECSPHNGKPGFEAFLEESLPEVWCWMEMVRVKLHDPAFLKAYNYEEDAERLQEIVANNGHVNGS